LLSRLEANDVVVIDELSFSEPKTREMAAILTALNLAGTSTLVTTAALDPAVYKSARNIDRVTVLPASDLNALAILQPRKMLVTKAALDAIKERAQSTSRSLLKRRTRLVTKTNQ
jgi:large subunit ribosomal protein L4